MASTGAMLRWGIEEPVDERQVARVAASRADRQLVSEVRFGSGRKSRRLFVADVNPIDVAAAMKGVGHRVQAVIDESVNSLHAGLGKRLDQFFRHGSGHDGCSRC